MIPLIYNKIFFNLFNFKVVEEFIKLPNGKILKKKYVKHPGSVIIIPKINDKIILLKQYRYTLRKFIYELPAGTINEDETPEDCAKRELVEETGFSAGTVKKIFEMYIAPGYSNEITHVFLAENLRYVGEEKRDEDEIIELVYLTYDKIIDLIKRNLIRDSKTIASLLYFLNFIEKF